MAESAASAPVREFITGSARPPLSIDEPSGWGKYRTLTWRQIAARDPFYCRGVACNVPGLKGRLAAEALALQLGVNE
jgi:hypothetical protein